VRLGGPDVASWAGVVGYFSYDIASNLEPKIGQVPEKRLGLPDAWFFMPQSFLVFDHLSRRLFVSRIFAPSSGDRKLEQAYEEAKEQLQHLVRKLQAVHMPPSLVIDERPLDLSGFKSEVTEAEFNRRVSVCLEAIKAGDVFQIQIGNRLSQKTNASPFDIFRHLRMLNPSPYMFFCRFLSHHLIGASPEMMLQVEGDLLTHRPIAGTRRRTWHQDKDLRAKHELEVSEKERAEHIMLVDLSRNDIGRVAAPGTVTVEELMKIEEYSHVFHLVSQVSGRIALGKDAFDALTVSFPNGTVTGAPKIKAMELINELETISREFYAGCLGLIGFDGRMRTTLLIRTIHYADKVAATQASAGIVYDSLPKHEWQETFNKMQACLLAIQNTH
jgi:anthranilate synthase component 1